MKALELEAWSNRTFELSHEQAADIEAARLVEVQALPQPGLWRLVAGSRIGIAVGRDWEVRVRPRIRVPQLLFLLGYAADPKGWRSEFADFETSDDLFDAIAHGFSMQAMRLAEQGLLHGYVSFDDRLPAVRGRIRFADQIARAAMAFPLEVSYDEFTADIPENRILKTATEALLRLPRIDPLPRRRLLALRAMLAEVGYEQRPHELRAPTYTRLNERYRPALALALLVLHATSLNHGRGPVASTAYVFDMNQVFERFLSTSLGEALAPFGGEVKLQRHGYLDVAGRVEIIPDIQWMRGGQPCAVIDAKHKALGSSGVRSDDAYQMLAYCTALRLRQGYLVYANDPAATAGAISVRNSNCDVLVRSVDLELEPAALLRSVGSLAAEIADSPDARIASPVLPS